MLMIHIGGNFMHKKPKAGKEIGIFTFCSLEKFEAHCYGFFIISS
jgi:hypothetical protein